MSIKLENIKKGNIANPPLLFFHGFLGSASDFESIMELLSSKYYCVSISLPWHGNTKIYGDYSFERIIDELAYFVEIEFDKKINLYGYSMGGRTALYLASKYPHLIDKLILESSSPGLNTIEEREQRVNDDLILSQKLEDSGLDTFIKDWYSNPLFGDLNKHQKYYDMVRKRIRNSIPGLQKSLQIMGTGSQSSLWDKLPMLMNYTLLIVGKNDKKYYNIALRMISELKNKKLIVVENAAHNVHFEQEERITEILKIYLEGVEDEI